MSLRHSILKVVAWFDVFDYPITSGEIHFFLDRQVPLPELRAALNLLTAGSCLFRLGRFYSLRDDPFLTDRRVAGNLHADELLRIAGRISRRLYQFPFVSGIGISGSLSKHYAAPDADIDYFIITRPGRLWIARTLMHLYKKWSFLRGRQDWYCMNYFVDETALEIQEKNIFTAIELITLLPACGKEGLVKFFHANNWATAFLPNYPNRRHTADHPDPPGRLKKFLEWTLNHRAGDWLDDRLRELTTRRWEKKEARGICNTRGLPLSLRTGKHFSRPNPEILQKKLLNLYAHRLEEYQARWFPPLSSSAD